jgi:hypothetical protein
MLSAPAIPRIAVPTRCQKCGRWRIPHRPRFIRPRRRFTRQRFGIFNAGEAQEHSSGAVYEDANGAVREFTTGSEACCCDTPFDCSTDPLQCDLENVVVTGVCCTAATESTYDIIGSSPDGSYLLPKGIGCRWGGTFSHVTSVYFTGYDCATTVEETIANIQITAEYTGGKWLVDVTATGGHTTGCYYFHTFTTESLGNPGPLPNFCTGCNVDSGGCGGLVTSIGGGGTATLHAP